MSGSKVSKKVKEAIGRNAREQNKLKSEIVSIDEKKMKKRQNELRTVVPNISVDDCGNCPDGLRPLSRALSPRNSLVRPRLPGVESKMSYALTPGGEDFVTCRSRSPSMPATVQPLGLPPIDSSIQGEKSKPVGLRAHSATVPHDHKSEKLAVERKAGLARAPSPTPPRRNTLAVENSNIFNSRSAPNSPTASRRGSALLSVGSNEEMQRFENILSGINRSIEHGMKQSKSLQYARRRSGYNVPAAEHASTKAQDVESLEESFRKLKNCKYLRGVNQTEEEEGERIPKELLPNKIVIGHTKTAHDKTELS